MDSFFFVNAMQVDFASVLTMEHTGMAKMFKSLEDTGLKGFLEASGLVYEDDVVEFFANAKVVMGTIISFVINRKLALTKDVLAKTFGLPTEGMASFLDIPSKTMTEMQMKFLGTDVSFKAPKNKKEMNIEYRLLHDIISKALCAKASSFEVVTSEKFDLMLAIRVGIKVNWHRSCFRLWWRWYIRLPSNLKALPSECFSTESGQRRPWRVCEIAPTKGVEQQIGSHLFEEKSECSSN
ncbi:hypothetical protein F511_27747 [Dorcoceras hygrometricum]|uniref:Uncharacterized protein n=1 Tax=Dorcoceras hygrometricum TaxID=472368 RepID=A0A2Z7CDN5_9LAMI|nr:hypothetical protein F511_27747 [Dorcoceras hygrometricum]